MTIKEFYKKTVAPLLAGAVVGATIFYSGITGAYAQTDGFEIEKSNKSFNTLGKIDKDKEKQAGETKKAEAEKAKKLAEAKAAEEAKKAEAEKAKKLAEAKAAEETKKKQTTKPLKDRIKGMRDNKNQVYQDIQTVKDLIGEYNDVKEQLKTSPDSKELSTLKNDYEKLFKEKGIKYENEKNTQKSVTTKTAPKYTASNQIPASTIGFTLENEIDKYNQLKVGDEKVISMINGKLRLGSLTLGGGYGESSEQKTNGVETNQYKARTRNYFADLDLFSINDTIIGMGVGYNERDEGNTKNVRTAAVKGISGSADTQTSGKDIQKRAYMRATWPIIKSEINSEADVTLDTLVGGVMKSNGGSESVYQKTMENNSVLKEKRYVLTFGGEDKYLLDFAAYLNFKPSVIDTFRVGGKAGIEFIVNPSDGKSETKFTVGGVVTY